MPSSDSAKQDACFDAFRKATAGLGKSYSIADSKKLFKPGVAGSLETLRSVTWASLRACGFSVSSLRECLATLAKDDFSAISDTPWLKELDDRWAGEEDDASSALADKVWLSSKARLVAMRVRVIPAKQFNEACASGMNKSDLLSSATLGLVANLVETAQRLEPKLSRQVNVYCDRHGGRRFYGGVLQHTFPDSALQVESESSQLSVYRLGRTTAGRSESMRVHFTVKGDSFLPVSLSSMIAKYLRECAMRSINSYFASRPQAPAQLRPTAGYPVDADRFLADIDPVIVEEKIDRNCLIRSR